MSLKTKIYDAVGSTIDFQAKIRLHHKMINDLLNEKHEMTKELHDKLILIRNDSIRLINHGQGTVEYVSALIHEEKENYQQIMSEL